MKRIVTITAVCCTAFAGAVWCAGIWNDTNFTMEERKWQECPTDLVAGANDGVGDGSHHPADDCGICHGSNGVAASKVLTLSATVYDSRAARMAVPGAEIVFQDYAGNSYSMVANDLGILWSEASMSGDTNLGSADDSNTWRYKAWVKAEGGERPMMTMPAVGGMTVPRMSCNMHHVVSGTLGGLWAAPASTLRSYPATGLSYQKHIFPILRSKCGPCHIPGATVAEQGLDDTFDYGAGLDLMTYAGSAVEVEGAVHAKKGILTIVNPSAPDASELFAKTVYGGTHGGGEFWGSDNPDYRALRQWIAEGALEN